VVAGSNNHTCDSFTNQCGFYVVVSEVVREIVVAFRGTKGKRQLIAEGWQSIHADRDFHGAGRVPSVFFLIFIFLNKYFNDF
jgi:hypothetical protein